MDLDDLLTLRVSTTVTPLEQAIHFARHFPGERHYCIDGTSGYLVRGYRKGHGPRASRLASITIDAKLLPLTDNAALVDPTP